MFVFQRVLVVCWILSSICKWAEKVEAFQSTWIPGRPFRPRTVVVRRVCPSFLLPTTARSASTSSRRTGKTNSFTALEDKRLEREIEENSRKRAQGGAGEIAAGAILGGLLLGPFGALFGASMGSNIGAKNAINRARQEEMERLGVTQDMLDAAQQVGEALERSMEGLKATRESLETQQRLARRLDTDTTILYDKAKVAMAESREEEARKLLMDRQKGLDRLKQILKQCAEEKTRVEKMEANVAVLEQRATEIEALLRRTVGAKALLDSSSSLGMSLAADDPLLRKFRDLGND